MQDVTAKSEMATLGCLIYDYRKHMLTVEDFTTEDNKQIFEGIQELAQLGSIDAIILSDKVGRLEYINQLTNSVSSITNFEHYQTILIDARMKRNVLSMARELQIMFNKNGSLEEMNSLISETLLDVQPLNKKHIDIDSVVDRADINLKEKLKKVAKYGISPLDNNLAITEGQLIIVGARPSHGKSAWLLEQLIQNLEKKTAIYSQEMPEKTVMQRIMANMSTVDLKAIIGKTYGETDYQCIKECYHHLRKSDVTVNDEIVPVEYICQDIRQNRYDIVFIDYLQFLRTGRKFKNKFEEVAEISRMLKTTAKQTGTVIVVAAMLNRDSTGCPKLEHLRWSAEIEADADVIILIHNTTYEDLKRHETDFDEVDFHVVKARNGDSGFITKMEFFRNNQKWYTKYN